MHLLATFIGKSVLMLLNVNVISTNGVFSPQTQTCKFLSSTRIQRRKIQFWAENGLISYLMDGLSILKNWHEFLLNSWDDGWLWVSAQSSFRSAHLRVLIQNNQKALGLKKAYYDSVSIFVSSDQKYNIFL